MRAKQILNAVPQSKVRLVHQRFTVTPVATAFVFVALAHCIVQISLQAIAYSANTSAWHTVSGILHESNVSPVLAVVDDGVLRICDNPGEASSCKAITSVAVSANNTERRGIMFDDAALFRRDVNVSDLSVRCIQALNWPNMILIDSRREDICFLVFQIWLLGISIVAILNESIPHLMTALVTHGLSSIWSAFQVSRCRRYAELYRTLVVGQACNGINVLSGFWAKRMNYLIPILVLNAVAFLITSIVSYKLFKVYIHRTFRRVGYSDRMNALYSYILSFSVALQVSAFIVICAAALWVEALFKDSLPGSDVDKTLFRVLFIHVCVCTLPWVFIGWTSFRREHRLWSFVFFITGLFMLGVWISAFPSKAFKQRFSGFPFFATMIVTSFVALAVTLMLGIICRLNFGKGLTEYLKSQDLIDESMFVPVVLSSRRQSTLRSLMLPERLEDGSQRVPSNTEELEKDIEEIHNDAPPAYSVANLDWNVESFYRESDRKVPIQDGHGALTTSTAGKDIVGLVFPEAVHHVERPAYVHASSSQVSHSEGAGELSRVTENASLFSRWNIFRDTLDSRSSSKTNAPGGQRESTRALSESSSIASTEIPQFRFDRTASQSLSFSSGHSTATRAQPTGRIGLPPSPNFLRQMND